MTKVLMVCNDLRVNGITSVIMNYIRNIDMRNLHIDIFAGEPINESNVDILEKYGCKVYRQKSRKKHPIKYYHNLSALLKKEPYDCIHVHTNSCTCVLELLVAKSRGVPKIIPHCHNTTCDHNFVHKALYPLFTKLYTDGAACSEGAGKHLYRDRSFTVLNNGIDIDFYRYSLTNREIYRKEFGIRDGVFVLGHVGLFNEQKNHDFLIDIFSEYHQKNENSVLLLVGQGKRMEAIREKVCKLNLDNFVIFSGNRQDVNRIYSAMDVFVLPSLWEGLPLVMVEAQANALPILAANTITKDAKCCDTTCYLPLGDAKAWAEKLNEVEKNGYDRTASTYEDITRHGFNIRNEADKLKKLYEGNDVL